LKRKERSLVCDTPSRWKFSMNFKVVDHAADLYVCDISAGQRTVDTARAGPTSSPSFTTDPAGSSRTAMSAQPADAAYATDLPRPAFAVRRARMNPDTQ